MKNEFNTKKNKIRNSVLMLALLLFLCAMLPMFFLYFQASKDAENFEKANEYHLATAFEADKAQLEILLQTLFARLI